MYTTSYRDQINPPCQQFAQKPVTKDYFRNEIYTYNRDVPCNMGLKKDFVANRIFLENSEPSQTTLNTNNMCKTNFSCKSTPTYTYLNKLGIETSPYFEKTKEGKFTSTVADGRLIDPLRSYNMQLGEKPAQVVYNMFKDNVSGNPALKDYGRKYTDYASINAGQIKYYIDKDLAEPFFNPVYGMPSKSVGMAYRDPMGNVKPIYNKAYSTEEIPDGLSSINDSTKFRDDIISRQQRVHNSQKYELAYNRY